MLSRSFTSTPGQERDSPLRAGFESDSFLIRSLRYDPGNLVEIKSFRMDMNWAIDALSAEWMTVMAAPAILGAALLLGLFLAWGAAWFILRRRLAHYKERLDGYRDQISKMQSGPIVAAADDLFDRSELRLLINGDEQVPTVVFFLNIWRWFFLGPVLSEIGTGKRVEDDPISLVVAFDRPTKVGTLQVKSDAVLPRHEIMEFNNRFAIIAFADAIPAGTLEITTQ
jgi:hypothetical protein